MPDSTGGTERGTPKSPNDEGICKCKNDDFTEYPEYQCNLGGKSSSTLAVKDFKVTESHQSSRGVNDAATSSPTSPGKDFKVTESRQTSRGVKDAATSADQKETEICKRDTHEEEKKDPLVKWFPDHISKDPLKHPLIPYPHPPPKIELRGGNYIQFCHCLKRNGLQSECPLTGCQGHRDCMQRFLPDCVPSGLRLPGKPPAYLQKADEPECYSKTELVKGYERVMHETLTGGTGGIEGHRGKGKSKIESRDTTIVKPPSATSLISVKSKEDEEAPAKKKKNAI